MMNIIFDIDGTLMDINHRRHFVEGETKDWKSFVANMKYDIPNTLVARVFNQLLGGHDPDNSEDNCIFFLTGRMETQRDITIKHLYDCGYEWEKQNYDLREHHEGWEAVLFMRPNDDYRGDSELKSELFDKLLNTLYPCYEDANLYDQNNMTEYEYNENREEDILKFQKETIIFDDRQSVVDMWRARGLTCFQVAEGDF